MFMTTIRQMYTGVVLLGPTDTRNEGAGLAAARMTAHAEVIGGTPRRQPNPVTAVEIEEIKPDEGGE
jgi:hypothetical protein